MIFERANSWLWLNSGHGKAAFNMGMDAALLQRVATLGQPVLRFYGWSEPAASFGYFQKFCEIETLTHLRPLVRRPTGGGLVPHDRDWTYSVAIPPVNDWYQLRAAESYQRVHEWVCLAFLKLGMETRLAENCRRVLPGQCFEGHEKFDVLWQGRKIAGAAQRRNGDGLLIQGSVQPLKSGVTRSYWESAMRAVAAGQGVWWQSLTPPAELLELAETLAREKFADMEYTRRR